MPFAENPNKNKNTFTLDPKIKLLKHYDRVKGIIDDDFKPPIMADIDVVEGFCNLDYSKNQLIESLEIPDQSTSPKTAINKFRIFLLFLDLFYMAHSGYIENSLDFS